MSRLPSAVLKTYFREYWVEPSPSKMALMKTFFTNSLTSLGATAALFCILEVGVRVFADERYYEFFPASMDWVGDPVLGWQNKPFYEASDLRFGRIVQFRTNVDGFRPASAVPQKAGGTVRVLLIGNSTVAAREMNERESIHYYLDSLLDLSGGKFEVVNAGVTAYATDQSLLILKRYIDAYQPDVVCYGYCVNDLYANLSHEYSGFHKPAFRFVGDSLMLDSVPQIGLRDFREANRHSLAALVQHSALYGILRPYIQRIRISWSSQTALEQGGGQDFDVYLKPTENDPGLRMLGRLIGEMGKICRERSARFLVHAHPDLVAVWEPYREFIGRTDVPNHIVEAKIGEISRDNGAEFVPFVDFFLEKKALGPFHNLPKDPHCNAMGYLLEAQVLAKKILD